MKAIKAVAITCSLFLLSGELFAQIDPVKKENAKVETATKVAEQAQPIDSINAFLLNYQNYLNGQKKPAPKKAPSTSLTTPVQAAKAAAANFYQNTQNLNAAAPGTTVSNQAQQNAHRSQLNLQEAQSNLQLSMTAPVNVQVAPKTLKEKQDDIKKAIAAKAALDKKAAETSEQTENK